MASLFLLTILELSLKLTPISSQCADSICHWVCGSHALVMSMPPPVFGLRA